MMLLACFNVPQFAFTLVSNYPKAYLYYSDYADYIPIPNFFILKPYAFFKFPGSLLHSSLNKHYQKVHRFSCS